ncbi:MAG: PCRF domain-containing protein [Oligoflexia bacterium]|nr:PCRF domain-containing protein [Oligoflexia bacterium]
MHEDRTRKGPPNLDAPSASISGRDEDFALSPALLSIVSGKQSRMLEISRLLETEGATLDHRAIRKLSVEHASLGRVVRAYQIVLDTWATLGMAQEDVLTAKFADEREHRLKVVEHFEADLDKARKHLKAQILESLPFAEHSAVMEFKAGKGAPLSRVVTEQLLQGYVKYLEHAGFDVSIEDIEYDTPVLNQTTIREAVLRVEGPGAYSRLRSESGVHRFEIPATRTDKLVTGTVDITIFPELSEEEFKLDKNEIEITTQPGSGPGGQNVNRRHTTVRARHIPSGLEVKIQNERTQTQNRAIALRILASKLEAQARQAAAQGRLHQKRSQLGDGEQSERIRSIDFIRGEVRDHRPAPQVIYPLKDFLHGRMEPLFESLLDWMIQQSIE